MKLRMKRLMKRLKKDITGKSMRDLFKHGGGGSNDSSTAAPDKGPQFTDQARQVAAGAGTVGYTGQTQNW